MVSFCQRLLKQSVVIQERLCVLTGLGSDYAPRQAQVVKRVACLICDQIEAAFLMTVLLLHRHVFVFFLHVTEKQFNFVYVCVY